MHRRGLLHGLGFGEPADPGNHSLVLPLNPACGRLLHSAVSRAVEGVPGFVVLPPEWLHITLETIWDPVDPTAIAWRQGGGVTPIRARSGQIEQSPYSLRFVPDCQEEIRALARDFGIQPAAGFTYGATLAYAWRDVDVAEVAGILERLSTALLTRRVPVASGVRLREAAHRYIRPDRPLQWETLRRWNLRRVPAAVVETARPAGPSLPGAELQI